MEPVTDDVLLYSFLHADEIMGDEDNTNTEGLKEEDKISGVLLNKHVPLEDPGPHIANEDGVEGLRGQPSNL